MVVVVVANLKLTVKEKSVSKLRDKKNLFEESLFINI